MHPIAALLAADHLNDLMREADNERRVALVRAARPASPSRLVGLGRYIVSALGRNRDQTTRTARTAPATAGQHPSDERCWPTDLELRTGHRA